MHSIPNSPFVVLGCSGCIEIIMPRWNTFKRWQSKENNYCMLDHHAFFCLSLSDVKVNNQSETTKCAMESGDRNTGEWLFPIIPFLCSLTFKRPLIPTCNSCLTAHDILDDRIGPKRRSIVRVTSSLRGANETNDLTLIRWKHIHCVVFTTTCEWLCMGVLINEIHAGCYLRSDNRCRQQCSDSSSLWVCIVVFVLCCENKNILELARCLTACPSAGISINGLDFQRPTVPTTSAITNAHAQALLQQVTRRSRMLHSENLVWMSYSGTFVQITYISIRLEKNSHSCNGALRLMKNNHHKHNT